MAPWIPQPILQVTTAKADAYIEDESMRMLRNSDYMYRRYVLKVKGDDVTRRYLAARIGGPRTQSLTSYASRDDKEREQLPEDNHRKFERRSQFALLTRIIIHSLARQSFV